MAGPTTVGIDPGKKGAMALLIPGIPVIQPTFYPLPLNAAGDWDEYLMHDTALIWKARGVKRVTIEECHAFPGAQAYSSAVVMEAYGMWRGVLAVHFKRPQVILVPASVWKKEMNLEFPLVKAGKKATQAEKDTAYEGRKQKALLRARAEFGLPFRTPKGRDMDGEAEAALIALYGSRL